VDTVHGAGCLLPDGTVLTCAHVVNRAIGRDPHDADWPPYETGYPCSPVTVPISFPLSEESGAAVPRPAIVIHFAYREPPINIAVLRPDPPSPDVRVRLARRTRLEDRFAAYGFPERADEGLWAQGTIGAPTGTGVQLNTDAGSFLEEGFSGAAVWDQESDAVTGIVVRAADGGAGSVSSIGTMLGLREVAEVWPPLAQWLPPEIRVEGHSHLLLPWADTDTFTGRTTDLDEVCRALIANPRRRRIVGVAGMGGVGKTAFAVHVAYRVQEHFDALFGIDLRGMDSGGALPTRVAMERLLGDLLPPAHVAADEVQLERQYRRTLAGASRLLILDNAADASQVRRLLVPSPACAVVITSRRELPSLEDVDWRILDLLSENEALALLGKLISGDRVPCDAVAARTLVSLCGRLPLALRLAAATLNHYRRRPVSWLAEQLREYPHTVLELSAEDGGPPLATTFAASFAVCRPQERHAFALLGLLTEPEFGALDLARLAGITTIVAACRLDALVRNQLLEDVVADWTGQPRYRFHDLLRRYAQQQMNVELTEEQRQRAQERLIRSGLETVETAEGAGALSSRNVGPPADLPDSVSLDVDQQ
jgi:NB-ARC domain/Trypsin-like peptidase domain